MKLLNEFSSMSEAEDAEAWFRARGVLTRVESGGASQLYGITSSVVKVGLWVVLDEQVADAEALTTDKRHVVCYKLSATEMQELEDQGKEQIASLTIYVGYGAALLILVLGLLLFYYIDGANL